MTTSSSSPKSLADALAYALDNEGDLSFDWAEWAVSLATLEQLREAYEETDRDDVRDLVWDEVSENRGETL